MPRLQSVVPLLACLCMFVSSVKAQCPIDYFVFFNDKPDDLAPGNNVVAGNFDITAMTWFDPDGTGPSAPYIVAAIHYSGAADCAGPFTIQSEWTRLDRWDAGSSTWVPITPRFDGFVSCFATFDENPSDSVPAALYIGGHFSGWSGINSPNIMRYNGSAFSAVRAGVNGDVHALLVFDDDSTGPIAPKLYVGGDMTASNSWASQGQVNCGRLLRLTGSLFWENPSSGFDDRVFALCAYDEDGPGPGIAKLVVGGAFSRNDTLTSHSCISVWDGSAWTTLAGGISRNSGADSGRRVFTLASFDEDGSGPLLPSLFVGGTFEQSNSGVNSPLVIRWRKPSAGGAGVWLAVPAAPDMRTGGGGDLPCGNGCSNLPHHGNRPRVTCLSAFDVDGTGSAAAELYIGGSLNQYVPFSYSIDRGLMAWSPATNTTNWVIGAAGVGYSNSPSLWSNDFYRDALAMLSVAGNGSTPPRLLIAGGVMGTGYPAACQWSGVGNNTTYASGAVSAWGMSGAGPSVTNQPNNTWVVLPGSTSAGFSVSLNGTAPFTYRWRKDGVDLQNGTSQGFGGVIGATGTAVILGGTANPVNTTSQGWYDCRVSNTCGTGYSTAGWLVVQPDAAPYFPIRFDAAVAPVATPIGNAQANSIYGAAPWPRFYSLVGGTPFAIAPTGNNVWRGRLASGSPTGNRSVTIPTSRFGVGEIYTLLNTDGASATNVRFQFNASGGLVYTTTLAGGNGVRSYSKFYGPQSTSSADTSNVFDSGITLMDKQRILLPNSFRLQTLTSITITDLGTDSTGRAILAGLTLRQRPPACGPADLGSTGGQRGADGVLDNNDFIVFIDLFFSGDLTADVGTTGGTPGSDGALDNNDFIVFINQFFGGC